MIKKTSIVALFFTLFWYYGFSQNDQYTYDSNGNLIEDDNKNIVSITYNVLNLPEEVIFSDGRKIINTYSADGKKISQKIIQSDGSTQAKKDFLENIVYASDQLEYINTSEGYVEPQNNQFSYTYQHKDQVGNIRTSFSDGNGDGSADLVKEEKNYYPFGLQWQQSGTVIRGRKHAYGYGGKEEINAFGLDWNDHGARMYDPAIARWNGIDQLSEKYYRWSPYNYVADNPITFNDPNGKELRIYYVENGVEKFYSYKGGKPKDVPNNKFVKQVLTVHQHNIKNGGGEFLKSLAKSDESVDIRQVSSSFLGNKSFARIKKARIQGTQIFLEGIIDWDPNKGFLTTNGNVLSPATILEHEAFHVWLAMNYFDLYQFLKSIKFSAEYSNLMEMLTILFAEQLTAKANGEITNGKVSRKNHRGYGMRTQSATSNDPNMSKGLEKLMRFHLQLMHEWHDRGGREKYLNGKKQ
ncbi:RHS repeat domain-containing protein [Aquimarina sp. 2304DJ70-9]|uniref:RHS repeat domain-containing protein n=1 Tax=Aquimarina penaris TaxID=3231044 RepID=UPI0034624F36